MAAGYSQVGTGYWAAIAVGTTLVLVAAAYLFVAVRQRRRRRHCVTAQTTSPGVSPGRAYPTNHPAVRVRRLIAEAIIVRERIAGQIDAETYRARMTQLALDAAGERRPHHNAY